MSTRNLEEHRPARNGEILELGPFDQPPTYEEQMRMTAWAFDAILNGYVVAHVRDDVAKTVRVIASPRPLVTA